MTEGGEPDAVHGAGSAAIVASAGPHSGAVFISYASADVAVADALAATLESHGETCWIAPRDVKAGALYAEAIVRAISDAKVLVLVLSANSVASAHVGKEVERASSKRHPVIALRIDDAPLSPALEYFLSESHWVDARAGGMGRAVAKLIAAIREPERSALAGANGTPGASAGTAAGTHTKSRARILFAAGTAVLAVALAVLLAAKFGLPKHDARESLTATVAPAAPVGTPAAAVIPERSVAVLPFVDMSEKKDQEYFSDGLSEELIDQLSKVADLRVPARTSSFYFKGKSDDISTIAQKLRVAHVLEGSVRRSGKAIRVSVQLIQADNGYDVWSQSYDRDLKDIFKVQDEIAGAVVQALKVTLLANTRSSDRTSNLDAYALLLQARSLIVRETEADGRQAIQTLRHAVGLDPTYAAAWTELANAYIFLADFVDADPGENEELARAAAQKAIALNPRDAAPHLALAMVKASYDHDWKEAIAETTIARRLDPNIATPVELAAIAGCNAGPCYDQVVRDLSNTIDRDPLNAGAFGDRGFVHYYGGELDAAVSDTRRALELSPNAATGHFALTEILIARHELMDVLREANAEPVPEYRRAAVAMAYQALGQKAQAGAALKDLLEQDSRDGCYQIAQIYAVRGDTDAALDWLERDYSLHLTGLMDVRVDPTFNSLRQHPRYVALMRKLGVAD